MDWMGSLSPALASLPLTRLSIPGSHDSGADFSLSTAFPVANDEGALVRVLGRLPLIKKVIRRWAVTQEMTISDQLSCGIRYFDLRVSFPSFPDKTGDGIPFRVVHALYGRLLSNILHAFRSFLLDHPREVLILDFNHLHNVDCDSYRELKAQILSVFDHRQLVPTDVPVWLRSLSDLQECGQNVLLLSCVHEDDPFFFPPCAIRSPYPESDNIPYIMHVMEHTCAERRREGEEQSLLVLQGVATATRTDIIYHPMSSLEKRLSRPTTQAVLSWLSTRSASYGINIVIADFVSAEFCSAVIECNSRSTIDVPVTSTKEPE